MPPDLDAGQHQTSDMEDMPRQGTSRPELGTSGLPDPKASVVRVVPE